MTPRARRARVGGAHGGALRVSVTAPPSEGKANGACIAALAEALDLPRRRVELDPASKGRRKRVRIRGHGEVLEAALRALATPPGVG